MPDSGEAGFRGLSRSFFRDLARERGLLLEAILRFNSTPRGSRNGLPPWVEEILDGSVRGRQSRIRLAHAQDGFWNFEEESSRLVLLEAGTLESLGLHFGAAVNARGIASVVERNERSALMAALGRELVDYALGRGTFQLGEARDHFLGRHQGLPLADRVRAHGAMALGVCAGRWPKALTAEAGKRFPGLLDVPLAGQRDHKLERLVWFGLKKLLIKEVAPQWAPCFS